MELLESCMGKMCNIDLLNDETAYGVIKGMQDGWIQIEEERKTRFINLEYVLEVTIEAEDNKKGKNLFRL